MKTDLNEKWLLEMRQAYLATADDKISELSHAIQRYVKDPSHDETRLHLHRLLHNLIGSGGSYGVPEVSMVARSMSDTLKRARCSCQETDISSLIHDLQTGLEQLRTAFYSA